MRGTCYLDAGRVTYLNSPRLPCSFLPLFLFLSCFCVLLYLTKVLTSRFLLFLCFSFRSQGLVAFLSLLALLSFLLPHSFFLLLTFLLKWRELFIGWSPLLFIEDCVTTTTYRSLLAPSCFLGLLLLLDALGRSDFLLFGHSSYLPG